MSNKIEINIEQVVLHSKRIVKSGEDAGKLMIKRDLDQMKQWSDDDISEIFREDGGLKPSRKKRKRSLAANDSLARIDLIMSTRKRAIVALRRIVKDKLQDSEFKMPSTPEYKRMAGDLISEENIRNKFENSFIVYDPSFNYLFIKRA